MRYSHWPDGSYPIFVNPTDKEILELASVPWDTIRINVSDRVFALASGHGNTHDSIERAIRNTIDPYHMSETYILFKDQGNFYFNLEDVSGKRRAPFYPTVYNYFDKARAQQLIDLVENT